MGIPGMVQLLAGLPPGPWEAVRDDQDTGEIVIYFWAVRLPDGKNLLRMSGARAEPVTKFIVEIRNNLATMLGELARSRTHIETLRYDGKAEAAALRKLLAEAKCYIGTDVSSQSLIERIDAELKRATTPATGSKEQP